MEQNQYTFDVYGRLTKLQIRQLIQQLYDVHVIKINTHRPPRHQRRSAKFSGYRTNPKRAIVRLRDGQRLIPKNTNGIF